LLTNQKQKLQLQAALLIWVAWVTNSSNTNTKKASTMSRPFYLEQVISIKLLSIKLFYFLKYN